MRVGLIVIATGKYSRFVPNLWASAQQFFLPGHDRELLLLSDQVLALSNCTFLPIDHEPWPGPTLHRYRSVFAFASILSDTDYLFMCDADMRFVDSVGDDILGDLVATIHPGFYSQPIDLFTYERNPLSRAFVPPATGHHYYAGGFQGGRADRYLDAANELSSRIADDEHNGLVAVWHDESHWNRYLIDFPPTIELSPSYCFPDGWSLPFEPRLLALNKNHSELRQ